MRYHVFKWLMIGVFVVGVTTSCGRKEINTTEDGTSEKSATGRLQRIGSVEKFIQFDAPNRSDIIFIFDTSPSMRVLWGEASIKAGMRAWFDSMRTQAENVPDEFDYFISGSTPNTDPSVSDDEAIVGGNGDLFFSGSTHSPEHGQFFMQGLDLISGFTYRPHVAINDSLIAIMNTIEHHRRTVGLDIIYFGDTDPDKSTRSQDEVISTIAQYRKDDQDINVHVFIKSPKPGVSFCSSAEVIQEIEANNIDSAAAKLIRLQDAYTVHAYALDRLGTYGCEGQNFETVFEKLGSQTNKAKDIFPLGTNIIEGIVKTEIDGVEVPQDTFQLQFENLTGVGSSFFIKFVNGPPPAGSTITVYYR
jgi:hypothetical protein